MAVTLIDLIARVRERCDLQNTDFVSDIEIADILKRSLARLYDIVTSTHEDYFVTELMVSIDEGDTILTPADFYKLLKVEKVVSGDQYQRVPRKHLRDEHSGCFGYNLLSGKIIFSPKQQAKGQYRILYVPTWTVADTDVPFSIGPDNANWEEAAVHNACAVVSAKGQLLEEAMYFRAERDALIEQIKGFASNRDSSEAAPPPRTGPRWWERGRL